MTANINKLAYSKFVILKLRKYKIYNKAIYAPFENHSLMCLMQQMKFIISLIITVVISVNAYAQSSELVQFNWLDPIEYGLEGEEKYKTINFQDAQYNFEKNNLPFFYQRVKSANGRELVNVQLRNPQFQTLSTEEANLIKDKSIIPDRIEVEIQNSVIRKQNVPYIRFYPIRRNANGQIERLESVEFVYSFGSAVGRSRARKSMSFASQSLLSSGEWFKIGVISDGVHKLSYNFLKQLGLDVENIDPRNISLFGYGGGLLPRANSEDRPDDMVEMAIQVIGENDGSFNRNDYILFYGEDQVEWFYDSSESRFRHQIHTYADTTFYFLSLDQGSSKRIQKQAASTLTPTQTINSFDQYDFYERDLTNLIKSGQLWVGETFNDNGLKQFNFSDPQLIVSEPASFEIYGVARAGVTSLFNINVANQDFQLPIGSTVLSRYEVGFARLNRDTYTFTPNSTNLNFNISYNKPQSVAVGWLNYLNVNYRSRLNLSLDQLLFRDSRSVGSNEVGLFQISSNSTSNPKVWDLSDQFNIVEMTLNQQGNQYTFINQTDQLREYAAFKNPDSLGVVPIGRVANQNLHSLPQADLLIISHPLFMNQAIQLEEIHEDRGLRVHTVTPQQIYNEFSSGAPDIIAMRSFVKMFYDRATNDQDLPKYVMLIGDASYDLKDRLTGNTNFVLSFQSPNSLQPTSSYISDDYIALLDDNEGEWRTNTTNPDKMDVGVGRLAVKTPAEASGVVEKIRRYLQSSTQGDWRNEIAFVGDDEDGNIHMAQADDLARTVGAIAPTYNVTKIYLDAFQQVSTSAGPRYPEVTNRITQAVESGSLILNYTGHGGETGWAGERVLDIRTINSWNNLNNLPLFVTATCEFTRFDDPFRTSGGELVLLNPNGGAIGLLTTTRLVFSSPNYQLNRSFYNRVFDRKPDGSFQTLGELIMNVKNDNANQINTRNFSLLGDPSLTLPLPYYQVITTEINGNAINTTPDTLNALSKATIKGYVADLNGNKLSNFNGLIFPTVFDKEKRVQTLSNDGVAPFPYDLRDNVLFKGKASVTNGDFSFEFVVPKDISYSFGAGKISYYGTNNMVDANGSTTNLIIGGSNPNATNDQLGPEIELFMNDESFVYGGITNNNPVLLAKLRDDQGINTVGNGIGHDIVAILDGNTEDAFVLNEFYEADLDNYQSGKVNFPFKDLPEGKHTITLKAWDVANNSSESTIEFNVVEDREIAIDNLVNYPNPFTTNTEFIFQHNQPGIPLDVKLEIFTVSGKLVKSIDQVVVSEGYLSRDIRWDGRDDFGDRIGKGVYVYKIKVRSRNGSMTEKFEKLVIL
jgi:hypothetical protein